MAARAQDVEHRIEHLARINPALAANRVQVIKDTHGKTSHLSAGDVDALILYLKSLQ